MTTEKLKHGDYFEGGTEEQCRELLEIERMDGLCGFIDLDQNVKSSIIAGFIVFSDWGTGALVWEDRIMKASHTFEDFKQKCINTFYE